jgi:hypothetical protein
VLNKKSWLVVPIYDEDNIKTFQQFTGFDHHVRCPAIHGGLDVDSGHWREICHARAILEGLNLLSLRANFKDERGLNESRPHQSKGDDIRSAKET